MNTLFENIKLSVITQLELLHLNLNHLWVLENSYLSTTPIYSLVPEAIVSFLDRKGFITYNKENSTILITEIGKKLYETLSDPNFTSASVDIKKIAKKAKEDINKQYLEWLKHYPATATWVDHTGRNWIDTRILRQNSVENEVAYVNVINEGIYSHKDMCDALDFQVEMVKKDSFSSNQNKMHYFQGTTPYLNQKTYIKQIETMKMMKWKPNPDKKPENKTVDTKTLF